MQIADWKIDIAYFLKKIDLIFLYIVLKKISWHFLNKCWTFILKCEREAVFMNTEEYNAYYIESLSVTVCMLK